MGGGDGLDAVPMSALELAILAFDKGLLRFVP